MMEIVVDAYGAEERAMGWFAYLDDSLKVPFKATCRQRIATSPLEPGDEVTVTSLADDRICNHAMYVMIAWKDRTLAVPLEQLDPVSADEATEQVIADWRY